MQDAIYRHDVTHRSMGYPHVPMTSYFLDAYRARSKAAARQTPPLALHLTGAAYHI